MKRRLRRTLLPGRLLALQLALSLIASVAYATDNILILMVDDVGVDKIGNYAAGECVAGECPSPPPTPNLDALAASGIRFRNAWATPVCSSTRVATLTGRHGFRTGIGGVLSPGPMPEPGLDPAMPNLANVLRAAGYDTAAFGKWHLSGCPTENGACVAGAPNHAADVIHAGFDYFAGSKTNLNNIKGYCSWDKIVSERTGPGEDDFVSSTTPETTYATTEIVNDLLARLPQMTEPWFIWTAFHASHGPLHVVPADPENCVDDYTGASVVLYDGMTQKLDAEIGRLLSSMGANGDLLDRTTIVFLGDNGTPPAATVAPFPSDHAKGRVYEGGVNVPFLVAGPQVAAAVEGGESAALIHAVDLFATAMEIAGIDPCSQGADCAEDSVSFRAYLQSPSAPPARSRLFTESFKPNSLSYPEESQQAVRDDRYKLVRHFEDGEVSLEYFDLASDPFEQISLLEAPLDPAASTAFDSLATELNQLIGVCADLDDQDTDCVPDLDDNCIDAPNGPLEDGVPGRGNQADVDSDGIGDACDPDDGTDPDDDDDGLLDIHETGTGTYSGPTDTGTDMNERDSDGDFVSDGNEVIDGSDPTDSASFPTVFSEAAAFAAHAGVASERIDFEIFAAQTTLSDITLRVDNNQPTDVTFPSPVSDILNLGGPALDLVVVEDAGNHPAVSGIRSLGTHSPAALKGFAAGTTLDFSFAPGAAAFGLEVIVPEGPGSSIADGELELRVPGRPAIGVRNLDRVHLGAFAGSEYYAYFLGTRSDTPFASASLELGAGGIEGTYLFRVDDLQALPEPNRWLLLIAGVAWLLATRGPNRAS